MADREHTPERDLDRDLRDLGHRIEYPPTPELAPQIRQRIEEDAEQTERPGISRLPVPSPKWAVAAAALLLLLALPVFSSGVRDNLSGILTAGQGAGGARSVVESGDEGADPDQAQSAGSSAQSSEAESGGAASSAASSQEGGAAGSGPSASEGGDFDRRIIRTAELGIRSENVRESAEEARRIAEGFDGSVLNSQVDRNGGSAYAELTLVVPSEEFGRALEELRGLGEKVTTDAVEGRDVTEEFVDLESQERNLLATEESLLRLYDESEDVNDTLSIQRELTDVRGEIEQVQGRIQYLEQRSATSRVNLSIVPAEEAATPPDWSPASTVDNAWNASLGFLQVIATAFLSVAVFSWWLVPILVLGLVWWRAHLRRQGPADS